MILLSNIFSSLATIYILALIALGFCQPLGAIIRIFIAKRKNSTYAIGLKRYLLAVIGYFIILSLLQNLSHLSLVNHIYSFYLFGLSGMYAIWYIRHIWIWRKKSKNIEAYDKLQLLNAPHIDRLLFESYPSKKVCLKNPVKIAKRKISKPDNTIIRKLPQLV